MYLRLDNGTPFIPAFATSHTSSQTPDGYLNISSYGAPYINTQPDMMQMQPQMMQPQMMQPQQQQALAPSFANIRGIYPLVANIGHPDITDNTKGGIAIWSSATLHSRGYQFLHLVEIIDEATPSLYPVKHFSNVYIWVRLTLSDQMVDNVNGISTDIFYDKGKQLLIVRSDSLDTAVAQATLIALYSNSKVSYYDIYNNDMLTSFYTGMKKPKVRRALYTILSNSSRR